MELKKEVEKKLEGDKKETLKKKKGVSLCKSKNIPLGFGFGFFTKGIITVMLISIILIPLTKNKKEVDGSFNL